jgi:hypothetical protein
LEALIRNGHIADPQHPENSLSTPEVVKSFSDPPPPGSGSGRTFIFAISEDFQIRVAPDGVRTVAGAVKHETLFHNADVLAAGEICIRDGIIAGLNDLSGSYRTEGYLETNPDFAKAVLRAFEKNHLPVDDALIDQLQHFTRL